jgi:hypothetical protein
LTRPAQTTVGCLAQKATDRPITLNGAQANFLRCGSAVAGGGVGDTPTIDLGGTGTDLVIRDYQGGIKLINHTSGSDNMSIDMSSGQVVVDSTITTGTITVRGIAKVTDNSTGTAVVTDETETKKLTSIDSTTDLNLKLSY